MSDFCLSLNSGTATLTFAKVPLYKCCSIGLDESCGSNTLPSKKLAFARVFRIFAGIKIMQNN